MTREELITIYRLKRKGLTSKEIADVTGISRGTIRSMFSRNPEFKEEGVCPCCGKTFEITIINPYKRFCSKTCKVSFWNKKRNTNSTVKKICPCCGKEFFNYSHKNAIYCSKKCFQESRRYKNEN